MGFSAPPALKRTHGGVHEGSVPLAAGLKGVQPLAFIIALVRLLHGHKLRQICDFG